MIVLPSLSELQQRKVNEKGISTLQGLDLQAALTVARKNIYSFRNIEYYADYYGMKDSISAMFEVRNDWAHPTPEEVTLTMTKTDLSRYIDFMERFGGSRAEINEAKEFRASVEMPNYGNPIRIQEPSSCAEEQSASPAVQSAPVKVLENPFVVGAKVVRKSNPDQVGMIGNIRGSGDSTEYEVMVTRRLGDILSDCCDEEGTVTIDELEKLNMGSLETEFRAMANHVIELSENLSQADEKLDRLLEVVENKSHQKNNKIILFSSFRHTLNYVEKALVGKGYRVAQVNGSVKDEERLALRQRFELPAEDPAALEMLLFTEVGCEGLDYQFCDFMINYDLPWNPMAIEQRIGRIDRRGQKSDTVIICNLVTEDTIDAKIYHRCLERIGVFESSIGECAGILGDMTQRINEAIFDSKLTQQEKEEKIEKIADNEVSRANEMKKLEDESKQLFGIDISGYVMDRKVMDAENPWIGERYIQALVVEYLNRVLGEKNYIQGDGPHKVLTLSGENRAALKAKLRSSHMKKSAMYNQWMDYLKGSDTRIAVTFNQEEAARDRNAIFFTAVHPLVRMAAAELHNRQKVYIHLLVDTADCPVPTGDYPFLLVERTIVGMRKEVRIVPISEINLSASDLCDLLETADYKEILGDYAENQWDALSQRKREQQQQALAQLTADVKEKCDYRRAAVLKSYQYRKEDLLSRIQNVEDANIKRMYQSQLRSLEEDKTSTLSELEKIQNRATVEENVIVNGIITVCNYN